MIITIRQYKHSSIRNHTMSKFKIDCPVERALSIIGGKWKIPIIFNLSKNPHRFGILRNKLSTITTQMLSKQLKEMERDGLVIRKVLSVMPPSVEYSLSEFGKSALPVLKSINNWSKSKDDQIIKIVKKNIKKIDSHITI